MNVYITYRINQESSDVLGVYSTFDLARSGLNRYINQYFNFNEYVWDKEDWAYKSNGFGADFCIIKTEVDKI